MNDDSKASYSTRQPSEPEDAQAATLPSLHPDVDASSLLSSSPPDDSLLDTPSLGPITPKSPRLSRNPSFSGSSSYQDDWDPLPPPDRLTVLDLLDNFALPQQLEKLQKGISAQTDKVRRSRDALKTRTHGARERMVEEWRRRLPSADEQLDRYRKRMRQRVDKLGKQWNNTKAISVREKISFICGVMNIFISGYLIGGFPQYFHLWYTAQLIYFMPIRIFTYHRRGYHYFLADLCYFVNLLLSLSIWVFPSSKRLFLVAYCLAFGNNAVAIIMWRNSLVFHSFDKVTSLFIHIMPCATLHCLVHLLPPEEQQKRFPAIWNIRDAPSGSPTAYANILSMLAWSTLPYAFWQLSYYFFITVRRKEKIAAGRPTSFTWLRRSYSKTWIGKFVLSLPESMQEVAFMFIQYCYACLTILPCPLWFYSRYASTGFLLVVFSWSIYNGSTYYIDVFGKRFQKELEAMKSEVTKWQTLSEAGHLSPLIGPQPEDATSTSNQPDQGIAVGASAASFKAENKTKIDNINGEDFPLLDNNARSSSTEVGGGSVNQPKERRAGPGGAG
jgi:hypothetical protein